MKRKLKKSKEKKTLKTSIVEADPGYTNGGGPNYGNKTVCWVVGFSFDKIPLIVYQSIFCILKLSSKSVVRNYVSWHYDMEYVWYTVHSNSLKDERRVFKDDHLVIFISDVVFVPLYNHLSYHMKFWRHLNLAN